MTGQLALILRYLLYPLAGALASLGFVAYDEAAGTLTISLHDLSLTLAGLVVYLATVGWSQIARIRGGKT